MIIDVMRNLRCLCRLCQSFYCSSKAEAIQVRTTTDDGLPVQGYPFLLLVGEPPVRYLDPLTMFHMRETLDSRSKTVRSTLNPAISRSTRRRPEPCPIPWHDALFRGCPEQCIVNAVSETFYRRVESGKTTNCFDSLGLTATGL